MRDGRVCGIVRAQALARARAPPLALGAVEAGLVKHRVVRHALRGRVVLLPTVDRRGQCCVGVVAGGEVGGLVHHAREAGVRLAVGLEQTTGGRRWLEQTAGIWRRIRPAARATPRRVVLWRPL